jgi:hypothetical protein
VTVTFALHGYDDAEPAEEFGPMQAEFERRGFPCRYIRSPRRRTKTPHRDRAQVMIEGLRSVEGEVALLGISNQGLFFLSLQPRGPSGGSCSSTRVSRVRDDPSAMPRDTSASMRMS